MIAKLILQIWNWFFEKKPTIDFNYVNELPEELITNRIYIIGELKSLWLISFKCPCGCGDTIHLNILKDAEPCWDYNIKNKKITLKPSIKRIVRCKSHFFIRDGEIKWV